MTDDRTSDLWDSSLRTIGTQNGSFRTFQPSAMIKETEIDDARSDASGSEEDDSTTSRSYSSSRIGNNTDSKALDDAIPILARGETQAVKRLRLLTICALLLVAGLCGAAVYIYTRNVEKTAFKEDFASSGLKVIQAFQDDAFRKQDALHSLSNTLTAYAIDGNFTWPYVTLDSSAHVLDPYMSLAGAASITILPIVPPDQRAEWEAYSVRNDWWIEHDYLWRQEQQQNENLANSDNKRSLQVDESDLDWSISPYIKNHVGIDLSPGPWFVWWQYVPAVQNTYFINFNRMATKGFTDMAKSLYEGFAVLSTTFTIVPGLDVQSSSDYFFVNEMLQAGQDGSYGVGEPLSYIYYPVFQDFDTENLVAGLECMVYWRSYFEYVLPDKIRGVVVVVKNSEGESFTYRINGKEAEFLGLNDTHSVAYEHMMLHADYTSFQDESIEADTNRNYKGVPVDDKRVHYWIEVYPSDEMQDIYLTNRPLIYTLAMVFFFALTTSIFLLYDWYVERRQRIVLSSALRSNAVVASMFPKNVRDRLLENAAATGTNKNEAFTLDEKHGLIPSSSRALPIADFYPETTVYFADVRGFTAWASTREPTQVFQLLESIYNSFDDIAKRRRVFKVETVGDCYVAVTGLPDPQPNHAVVMARFARDCTTKFNQLVRKLETSLGPDTADLALRTGIHSGPVTGGVIRGENARFQLFGDTVNTAARMESTGSPSRIQVSQETADLLIAHGKQRWLVSREDEVLAKGKGVLKTFWLNVSESAAGSSNGRSLGSSDDTTEDRVTDDGVDLSTDFQPKTQFDEKTTRLVLWNVDLLTNLLIGIQAARRVDKGVPNPVNVGQLEETLQKTKMTQDRRTIEEIRDIISLPEFDR